MPPDLAAIRVHNFVQSPGVEVAGILSSLLHGKKEQVNPNLD